MNWYVSTFLKIHEDVEKERTGMCTWKIYTFEAETCKICLFSSLWWNGVSLMIIPYLFIFLKVKQLIQHSWKSKDIG